MFKKLFNKKKYNITLSQKLKHLFFIQCKSNSLMPIKRCGPLKLVKRKKDIADKCKNDENCYSSPSKKSKTDDQKVIIYFYKVTLIYN